MFSREHPRRLALTAGHPRWPRRESHAHERAGVGVQGNCARARKPGALGLTRARPAAVAQHVWLRRAGVRMCGQAEVHRVVGAAPGVRGSRKGCATGLVDCAAGRPACIAPRLSALWRVPTAAQLCMLDKGAPSTPRPCACARAHRRSCSARTLPTITGESTHSPAGRPPQPAPRLCRVLTSAAAQ